jgi:hypothetical protein
METSDKKCSEVIKDRLESRQQLLSELYHALEQDEKYEDQDALDYLYDFALGISKHTIVRIDLSTGGPADWLEVIVLSDYKSHTIDEVQYHVSDWFDHASLVVEQDSPLYRYAEETVELIYNP